MRVRLKNWLLLLVVVSVALGGFTTIIAQEDNTGPVVYGFLFFSQTCPHCHDVINNNVPEWEDEFGDSFILIYLDVAGSGVANMLYATCDALGVTEGCGGVPMMVIGDQVMLGSREIPARTPQLIRDGLDNGGIGVPDVTEIQEWVDRYVNINIPAEATAETEANTAPPVITTESRSWVDKFNADPKGNGIAVATLLALLGSMGLVAWFGNKGALTNNANIFAIAVGVFLFASSLMVLSLVLEETDDTLATALSWGTLILLVVSSTGFGISKSPDRILPLVALAGLCVAVYLTQVEVSDSEASCGLVGDCNAVQESSYATLFGVLPIGVLGVLGYIAILMAWGAAQYWGKESPLTPYAQAALFGMILFGVAFSIYLTFLEPFVIGATCAWCITSALLMAVLLWMVAPMGWQALQSLRQKEKVKLWVG
jgi:uncharacterized membrane protein